MSSMHVELPPTLLLRLRTCTKIPSVLKHVFVVLAQMTKRFSTGHCNCAIIIRVTVQRRHLFYKKKQKQQHLVNMEIIEHLFPYVIQPSR